MFEGKLEGELLTYFRIYLKICSNMLGLAKCPALTEEHKNADSLQD